MIRRHMLPAPDNKASGNKYLIPLLLPDEKPAMTKDLITPFEEKGAQNDRVFEFDCVPGTAQPITDTTTQPTQSQ